MADFYPVLARAVSKLVISDLQARRELYDYARRILVAQLRERNPHVSVSEIMREQSALETAVRRVEAESRPAQAQRSKRQTSFQMTANQVTITDEGMPSKISETDSAEAFQASRARLVRGTNLVTSPDRIGSGPQIGRNTNGETELELSGTEQPTFDEDISKLPLDIATRSPLATTTDGDIEASLAFRNVRAAPAITAAASKLQNSIGVRQGRLILDDAKARPAQSKEFDTNKKRAAFLRPMHGIVLIAAIMPLFVIVVAPIYSPRLVWLSEHLIDNPNLIIAVAIILCMFGLLLLPFFRKRRTK